MGVPASDRFLNCVLRRAGMDITINRLVIVLIVPCSLTLVLYLAYLIYKDWGIWFGFSDPGEYLISLFFSIDMTFITYSVIKSVTLVIERGIIWTDSLTAYAEENGKDTSELQMLADEMRGQRTKRLRILSFLVFLAMISMMVISFFVFDFRHWSSSNHEIFRQATLVVLSIASVDMFVTGVFTLMKIRKVDYIQCWFTDAFRRTMDDDWMPKPMVTDIEKNKRVAHVILIIATVIGTVLGKIVLDYLLSLRVDVPDIPIWLMVIGLYFTFLFFYSIHVMNRHIRVLWKYENELLDWMSEREGAKKVVRVPIDKDDRESMTLWESSFGLWDYFLLVGRWLKGVLKGALHLP